MKAHTVTRVNDQMQCSCGLQWDINETDPHKAEGLKVLQEAREAIEALPDKRCGNCVNDMDNHCARGRWEFGRDLDNHYIQVLKAFDVSRCIYWRLKG
jgi:hypothetical protein